MDQKNYAVYDSSVAVCLNALQLNQNISEGYVFNYVKGRNNIIGNSKKKIGFTQYHRFKECNLVAHKNWKKIPTL